MADNRNAQAALGERGADLSRKSGNKKRLQEIYKEAEDAFRDQSRRSRDTDDYWDIYNCVLGSNQSYIGDNSLFIPVVFNAIEARKIRFSNQIFPTSGSHVECISSDATSPRAITALAEHYIRKTGLRTLLPQLLINGDVEGHYWLYTRWSETERSIVRRVKKPVQIGIGQIGMVNDLIEETLVSSHPVSEIIADSDVSITPATSATLMDAIEAGGSVTIRRRWGKAKIRKLIDVGMVDKMEGERLLKDMTKDPAQQGWTPDREKKSIHAAGIAGSGHGIHAIIYETWAYLEVDGEDRLCQIFYAGKDRVLHAHRNPLWCDLLPLLSGAQQRIHGSHKGLSVVSFVRDLQYFINDMANESADSSMRSQLPIVLTDPAANPRYESMVAGMWAVWKASPNSTKILEMPPLWRDAGAIIQQAEAMIMQTLNVNPSMITQSYRRGKPTQAEQAQEHSIDLLTTSDAVTVVEKSILNPWLELVIEMDHQYRDEAITIQSYGEMGMAAAMEEIGPLQMDARYMFRWNGVEQVRNAQQLQSQIAAINVVRGIPPQLYPGYVLNLVPAIVPMIDSAFGAQRGRLVFQDLKELAKTDPAAAQVAMQQSMIMAATMQPQQGAPQQGRGRRGPGPGMPMPGAQPRVGAGVRSPPGATRKPAMPLNGPMRG